MRLRLIAALVAAAAALPAADAAAQDTCEAPAVTAFLVDPDHVVRAGQREAVAVQTRGATTVTIAWPDGTSSTAPLDDGGATFGHTFLATGVRRIVATASGPCGPPASGARTVEVHPPCAQARDASVLAADCDLARATLQIRQAGLMTPANALAFVCRDVIYPPIPQDPEPVARAAACAAPPPGPPKVAGRLPVRSHSVISLHLGAPATRVSVALGGPSAARTPYRRAARAGASGRVWRIRVATVRTSSRLWIKVNRPRVIGEPFVAGLAPR